MFSAASLQNCSKIYVRFVRSDFCTKSFCRFLRPYKPWNPPVNVDETVLKICTDNGLTPVSEFDSLDTKFRVLKACFEETGHSVPNSLLHSIETVGM